MTVSRIRRSLSDRYMRPDADRVAGEKGWVFKQDATRGAVSSADPTRELAAIGALSDLT